MRCSLYVSITFAWRTRTTVLVLEFKLGTLPTTNTQSEVSRSRNLAVSKEYSKFIQEVIHLLMSVAIMTACKVRATIFLILFT